MSILFSSDSGSQRMHIARQVAKGELVKIHAGIYTDELGKDLTEVVKTYLWEIAANLVPGGLVSHRSAVELRPSPGGYFFLTGSYYKKTVIQGITFVISDGPGPMEGDRKLGSNNLYQSQYERMLLENLSVSRTPEKVLGREPVEIMLKEELMRGGEARLNGIRDKARAISTHLGMVKEFRKLDGIIGALLTTRPATYLESPEAKAMAKGAPYDAKRVKMFESLAIDLDKEDFKGYKGIDSEPAWRNFSFFEAYFSNYIEGTVFTVEEAEEIVKSGTALPGRPADSHDILGTYGLVASREEMARIAGDSQSFMDLLRARHAILLKERPSMHPGLFKARNNRAGNYEFVDHRQVAGTIEMAWRFYDFLDNPVARAFYVMFITSEVHPFDDGNGRMARIMMNAELHAGGFCKLLIPNVYRRDYLSALRAMSVNFNSIPYIRMLNRVYDFSSLLTQESFTEMHEFLTRSNAFSDNEGDILRF